MVAVVAATARGASAQPRHRAKPNIIFIMADDLGIGHLECYGQQMIGTPNLDRMAREAMRFTQAMPAAPYVLPRAAY